MKKSKQYFQDERYKVETTPQSRRMSHWVYSPVLTDTETGTVIFDLSDSDWDLREAKESEGLIMMTLARYPDGATTYKIDISPEKSEFILDGSVYPVSSINVVLDGIV
ncbi:MAG: hypothetical protein HRU20_28065 [Pseudomonadales bacterium]|nr:hypothetical protein [Pseudomonadales bacterium]